MNVESKNHIKKFIKKNPKYQNISGHEKSIESEDKVLILYLSPNNCF